MVWIVRGSFHNSPTDPPDSIPSLPTSHYLRPQRTYKTGRSGGLRSTPTDGKGPVSRERLYDFRIKSLNVSKDGAWEFECGGGESWNEIDDPQNPKNLDPYPLTVHLHRKVEFHRRNEDQARTLVPVVNDDSKIKTISVEVRDGDKFVDLKGYWFQFEWKPMILCFPTIKEEYRPIAKSLGLKLSCPVPKPYHTHYLISTLVPTHSASIASLLSLHIVHPQFLQRFINATKLPTLPSSNVQFPLKPQPLSKEEAKDPEKLKEYDQMVRKYELEWLKIDHEIGSDPETFPGKSLLETCFDLNYPFEETTTTNTQGRGDGGRMVKMNFLPKEKEGELGRLFQPEKWTKRDQRRSKVFEGLGFVDFRDDEGLTEREQTTIELGSGTYFSCDLLSQHPLPSTSHIVEEIKRMISIGLTRGGKKVEMDKLVLMVEDEKLEKNREVRERLEGVRKSFNLSRLNSGTRDLLQAIYDVDPSGLLNSNIDLDGEDDEDESQSQLTQEKRKGVQGSGSSMVTNRDPSQATPPFPTGGVIGTHPESLYVPPPTTKQSRRTLAAKTGEEEGGGGNVQPSSSSSMMMENRTAATDKPATTTQPKKLTRRARTAQPTENFVENLLFSQDKDNDEDDVRGRGGRGMSDRYGDDGSSGSSSRMAVTQERSNSNSMNPPAPPPSTSTTTTKLRRRAGGAGGAPPASTLFGFDSPQQPQQQSSSRRRRMDQDDDDDDDDDDDVETRRSDRHQEMVRDSVPREERLRRLMEEDQREIRQSQMLQSQSQKGKGKGKESEKRSRSERGGGGESSEEDREGDEQERKKRKSQKSGEESAASLQKRNRDEARGGRGGSRGTSEGEGEKMGGSPPPKKKVKKVVTSTETASPKNKKEATAQKKADKEAQEKERAKLLQIKASKRKGPTAEIDQALNDDFNALKIVRPVLKSMPKQDKKKMRWNEEDSDVERDRMIREDQERDSGDDEMDPTKWRQVTQAMFNVRELEIEKKERAPRRDDIELPEKWANRPNFKRFRPKNSKTPRIPLADRPQVELAIPDAVDFGLGDGYVNKKGPSFSQVQHEESEEDEDEMYADLAIPRGKKGTQGKLEFGKSTSLPSTTKKTTNAKKIAPTKRKGKAKQVVVDSEEEEEDELDSDDSSHTLKGANDDMDVDEDGDFGLSSRASSTAASRRKTGSTPAVTTSKGRTTRKAAPQTIMIDDSDSESDSGLTFKGFGKQGR